jgi:hypothetical protein
VVTKRAGGRCQEPQSHGAHSESSQGNAASARTPRGHCRWAVGRR